MERNRSFELKPLKLIIHGPPAAGKTKQGIRLCQRYGAHYISVKTMIEETLEELRQNIEREKLRPKFKKSIKSEDALDEEDEISDEEESVLGDIEDWQEQIRDIQATMSKNENGKLPDDYVVRLMRDFLLKDICQTRGYILDGFPKTIEQAKELFGQAAEKENRLDETAVSGTIISEGYMGEEDVKIGNLVGNASTKIIPGFVVSLEGEDDLLCQIVMQMTQKEIQGTHFEEVKMLRRLAEYRDNNTPENTVLRFFDEAGIHPILIDLEDVNTGLIKTTDEIFEYIVSILGPPVPGFGISLEEEEEIKRLEEQQRQLQMEADRIEKQLFLEKATKEYEEKMEKWAETFEKLQKEEEKLLAAQSEPLRSYLLKYIFPTLSKGLIEVAKLKPEDPIDFLAEYLFKENPEGKMFDPSYTREGEKILEEYKHHVQIVRQNQTSK